MGRKFFVGGNWKCNGTTEEVKKIVATLNDGKVPSQDVVEVVLSPPFVFIPLVQSLLRSDFHVAAQNCWVKKGGAFTGEVSAEILVNLGIPWVIVGHSERRALLGESNEFVGDKVAYALSQGLKVVACVGETLDQREAGSTVDVVAAQIKAIAEKISDWENVVVAYEPVWAIGTGKVATPLQAQEVSEARSLDRDVMESGLTFTGFAVFNCTIRPDSASVLNELKDSSHDLVMITGDQALTACHVASQVHIISKPSLILVPNDESFKWVSPDETDTISFSENQVEALSDSHDLRIGGDCFETLLRTGYLLQVIPYVKVFSRVVPEQIELILTTLKTVGRMTLMCGDGTNDVGALKQIKALKEAHLVELQEFHLKISQRYQQSEMMPLAKQSDNFEKMKSFEVLLERFIAFLQIPKNSITPLKEKLPIFERQINDLVNANRKPKPLQRQGQQQLQHPGGHAQSTIQHQQSQVLQVQQQENIGNQVHQMNTPGSITSMQSAGTSSMRHGSITLSSLAASATQQNATNSVQSASDLDPGQVISFGSLQQGSIGSVQQNGVGLCTIQLVLPNKPTLIICHKAP